MQAWVLKNIGEISYEKMDEPQLSETDVLIEIKTAGICGSDIQRVYENGAYRMPLIPGHEFAGQVVKLGKQVEHRWIGKRVGVFPLIPCKQCKQCLVGKYEMCSQYSYLGSRTNGGFSEYVVVPEWNLIELSDNISYEEAAMLEPMAVSVHAMRRVQLVQTDTVVVFGLGTIGQFLTMFLKEKGVKNIFVIGNKEIQKQTALKFGIQENHYCDSRTEDVKEFVMLHTANCGADVVFECVGKKETVSQAINLTAPAGQICLVGNPSTNMEFDKNTYWNILRHQLKITGTWNSSYSGNEPGECATDDWKYVIKRLEQKLITPKKLITHRFEMKNLEQGLSIIKNNSEDYIKIMMVRE